MKKIYIKDIKENRDILKQLYNANEELQQVIWQNYVELQGTLQQEFVEEYLGKEWYRYINYYDHYNTFYLRLENKEKFIKNLDIQYGTIEEQKMYQNIINLIDKRDNTKDDEEYDNLDEKIEEECISLLELIEKGIHNDYENINNDDIIEYFIEQVQENDLFENLYYYEEENNYNLYEDINYTKNWN